MNISTKTLLLSAVLVSSQVSAVGMPSMPQLAVPGWFPKKTWGYSIPLIKQDAQKLTCQEQAKEMVNKAKSHVAHSRSALTKRYHALPHAAKIALGAAAALYGMISAIDHLSDNKKNRDQNQLRLIAMLAISAASTALGGKMMMDGVKAA